MRLVPDVNNGRISKGRIVPFLMAVGGGGSPPAVTLTDQPSITPSIAAVGDNVTLTLGTWQDADMVTGVLMQGGVDRTSEIVDGVWSPGVDGDFTWSVTASNAHGSTAAAVRWGLVKDEPSSTFHQVDVNKVLLGPDGERFIAAGAQFMPSTLVLHEERDDYRYRVRFGKVVLHDSTEIPSGVESGISEPTYISKLGWNSATWVEGQLDQMVLLGINCIQIGVEPAMQFVPPYIDPINGQPYPSEMQILDQVVNAATQRGMSVMLRQSNDRCLDDHINSFMEHLAGRYIGHSNVWLNPANEINCFAGGNPSCSNPSAWVQDITSHIQAIRGAGWLAPIFINVPSYSGDMSGVASYFTSNPILSNDPNLIVGLHHYKRNADPDFETARLSETETKWAYALAGNVCALVEESGPNNLGIVDLDPDLNPPNPSSDPQEWADTVVYFNQFLTWLSQKTKDEHMHGFIAFNWGSWSGTRNRDNGMTRIGTDGALTGWGNLVKDKWLDVDHRRPIDYSTAYAYGDQSTPGIGPNSALIGAENGGAAGWDWSVAGTGAEVQKDAQGLSFGSGKRLIASDLTPDTTGGCFMVVEFTAETTGGTTYNILSANTNPATYVALRVNNGNVQFGYNTGSSAVWLNIGPVTFGQRQVAAFELDDDAKTIRHYLSGGEITTVGGRTFEDNTFTHLVMGNVYTGHVHRYAVVTRSEGQPWSHDFVRAIEDFTNGL